MSDATFRCARCGVSSSTGLGFQRVGVARRHLCHRCLQQTQHRSGWLLAVWLWSLVTIFVLLRWASPDSAWLPAVSILIEVYLAAFLITVVHELGHAIFARLAGFSVARITIGAGPRVATIRIGGFRLELAAFPVGGLTAALYRGERIRGRVVGTILAGPLAHGAFVLAVAQLPAAGIPLSFPRTVVQVGIWLLVLNLLPLPLAGGTDGRKALDLLRMADQEVAALGRTEDLIGTGLRLQSLLASGTPEPGEAEELREQLARDLAHPGLTGMARAVTLNNLAVVCLLGNDPELLAEADRASALAYEAFPSEPSVAATRGEVLAALGRDEEAIALLEPALHRSPAPAEQYSHALLALSFIRQGNLFRARRHLALADPAGRVVDAYRQAAQLIAEAELRNLVSNYHRPDRSAAESAELLRADAGAHLAAAIGRSLAPYLSDPEGLASVVTDVGGLALETAPSWLREVVAALGSKQGDGRRDRSAGER